MTEPLPGPLEAAQLLVETVHGPDYRLGTATAGHTCAACRCPSVETAPLLKVTVDGADVVAWFSTCCCIHCQPGQP